MKLLFIILFAAFIFPIQAQVGIGTTNPQNDLHVNGGIRIENTSNGSNDDAKNRLLAKDLNGDIVNVTTDQVIENVGIPQLAYNGKFGVTTTSIFPTCSPCNTNDDLRIELVSPQVNINNTSLIQLIDPSTTNGDEYFQIQQDGFYRFEINTSITISGSSDFLINLQLNNDKLVLPDETDSFRVFGGVARGNITSAVSLPIYATDVRSYTTGDRVSFNLIMAYVGPSGSREVYSIRPIGASYIAQVTITKY